MVRSLGKALGKTGNARPAPRLLFGQDSQDRMLAVPLGLQRFVEAQANGVFEQALAELRCGAKRSHWMWFIFPQLDGLGRSDMARRYAIADLAEARSYLAHPLLGPRLVTVAQAAAAAGRDPVRLMGAVDAVKLRSSVTLFEAAGGGAPFVDLIDTLFDGNRDEATLTLLRSGTSS